MRCLLYILSALVILTTRGGLVACQHAPVKSNIITTPDWADQYDYAYDQLDQKEIRTQKHAQYDARLAREEAYWLTQASFEASVAPKLKRAVTKLIVTELKRRGLDPESVCVKINLSCHRKK